jgi:hypothetical protein
MKKLILMILALVLLVAPAWAANTYTMTGTTISVVPDGSTNIDPTTVSNAPAALNLICIIFQPSAANDKIQVRQTNASGAVIWPGNLDVLGAGQVVYYDGMSFHPYIVASECTFGTAANAKITFVYKNYK